MSSIVVSVDVNHDKAHAWEFYFNQTNSWWSKDYHTSSKTKRFIIDTYIGGKCYEDFGEGSGLVWGEIIGVDYANSLHIRGNLIADFGGPAITFEKFSFIEKEEQLTTVTYTVDFVGNISERSIQSLKKGWEDILQNKFKAYCMQH